MLKKTVNFYIFLLLFKDFYKDISPSKIAVNFCYGIYKIYTKPASLLTIAIDLARSLRHRFRPSTRIRETGVFENLHSGERFRKPPFSVAENAVYVWTQRENGGKNLHFQKYPDTCGRDLIHYYKMEKTHPIGEQFHFGFILFLQTQ